MPRYPKSRNVIGLAAAVAWVAAACSGSKTTTFLTTAQAAEVSQGVSFDLESEISDATATGGVTTYADAPPVGAPGLTTTSNPCTITRAPSSPTDTDGDGVVDSVSITLTNCVMTYAGAPGAFAETDTLFGTIILKDPTLTTADHNALRIYSQVERIRERQGSTGPVRSTETWNGTRTTTRDSSTLKQAESGFQTAFALPDNTAWTNTKNWTSTFTADTAGSIKADKPLPSGTWNFSGSGTWTGGTTTFNITIATTAPLHYNAACTATPRFDSGVITATLTPAGGGSGTGTVTMTFASCGSVSGKNS